jgi:hypothetical protein
MRTNRERERKNKRDEGVYKIEEPYLRKGKKLHLTIIRRKNNKNKIFI